MLRNVIVMNEGDTVTEKMLRETLASGSTLGTAGPPSGHSFPVVASSNPSIAAIDLGSWRQPVDIVPLSTVERATIERAIAVCSGNIPRAAALLGVSASTIYRKKQAWDADPSAIA